MPINPLGSSANPTPAFDPLIQKIIDRVDADKNGQISQAEFGNFLTKLLGAAEPNAAGTADDGDSGAGDSATPAMILPSTWTANNCQYGVMFVGWSPQEHTNLTLADLGVPGKAEKYAVYNYLVTNKIQPTGDWAPGVADALNQLYGTSIYRPIDGETLGFGNEYVHSAPNGYGMEGGSNNPYATGEFFWGWT